MSAPTTGLRVATTVRAGSHLVAGGHELLGALAFFPPSSMSEAASVADGGAGELTLVVGNAAYTASETALVRSEAGRNTPRAGSIPARGTANGRTHSLDELDGPSSSREVATGDAVGIGGQGAIPTVSTLPGFAPEVLFSFAGAGAANTVHPQAHALGKGVPELSGAPFFRRGGLVVPSAYMTPEGLRRMSAAERLPGSRHFCVREAVHGIELYAPMLTQIGVREGDTATCGYRDKPLHYAYYNGKWSMTGAADGYSWPDDCTSAEVLIVGEFPEFRPGCQGEGSS